MRKISKVISVILMLACCCVMGCQREGTTEKVETPTDKAAEAIERVINTPIEKAKGVEGTLQRAADRTAEQTQKAGE
ncbi:MAG: hypothetical protein M3Z35_07660 [Nitrospirota bacterium]|nr:hypothetical protein [Nitrospirota bacterium]